MQTKKDGESHHDRATRSNGAVQQLSGEAIKVPGEALNSVFSNVSSVPPMDAQAQAQGHRRSHSEIVIAGFRRSNSFQKLKTHVEKAWRWGGRSREEGFSSYFDPEDMANQKRLWYQLRSKTMVFDSVFS